MKFAKAVFVIKGTNEKNKNDDMKILPVMHNPEEYSLLKENVYDVKKSPGSDYPIMDFVNKQLQTLSLKLFYDTSFSKEDVQDKIKPIIKQMSIGKEGTDTQKVKFIWGSFIFEGYILSIDRVFKYFTIDGIPVRADVTVKIKGICLSDDKDT